MKSKLILLLIFQSILLSSGAQNSRIDSLLTLIRKDKPDTNKLNHMDALSMEFDAIGENDSFLYYQNSIIQLSNSILKREIPSLLKADIKKRIANSYHNAGNKYSDLADYENALKNYFSALEIDKKLQDKNGISKRLRNIGIVYSDQGEYSKAKEYYFKALKMDEDAGNKKGIAANLSNLGVVYYRQGEITKGLEFFLKALKLNEETKTKNYMAVNLGNIGLVYNDIGDYTKSLKYYQRAMEMDQELGNQFGIARHLGNIGNIYIKKNDLEKALYYKEKSLNIYKELGYKGGIADELGDIGALFDKKNESLKALEYFFESLKIQEELGIKAGLQNNLINIGALYTRLKKFTEAEQYLLRSDQISRETGSLDYTKQTKEHLSDLYFAWGQQKQSSGNYASAAEAYRKSCEHHVEFSLAKDSLFNNQMTQDITRKEMNYEYEKKEAAARAEQEKKEVQHKAEIKQQTTQRNGFIAGFALMIALTGVSFRSYRNKRKANGIISLQKKEVEDQKHLIEEKQKEIIDSINYAKRLQEAILPPATLWRKNLSESFVLYKPKDIVAGDFFWMEDIDKDQILFAAADCTGHGVPGAMVSLVCSNALNRAVKEFGITEPGKILDKVRLLVIETFEKSESEVKDGMDISLCLLNKSSRKLKWAGANNPLWIIRKNTNEISDIKADKQPIGKYAEVKNYTTHDIHMEKGDRIYIFTDGFADQFGGEKGKKFMSSNMKKLFLSLNDTAMEKQQEIIDNAFESWKQNIEQVDDVCVIGVTIN